MLLCKQPLKRKRVGYATSRRDGHAPVLVEHADVGEGDEDKDDDHHRKHSRHILKASRQSRYDVI